MALNEADVVPLNDDQAWTRLRRRYEYGDSRGVEFNLTPLRNCFDLARRNGARTAVVEKRYVDIDYQSEYSSFFSFAFASSPSVTDRVHFFRAQLDEDDLTALPRRPGYLGYMICRPRGLVPVGRTMLAPPRRLARFVTTAVTETVTFFGQPLAVTAMPFMQQDARFGRCAHVSAWSAHYTAYRRGDVGRRVVAEFSVASSTRDARFRPLPSEGMTTPQRREVFDAFGLQCETQKVSDLLFLNRRDWYPEDALDETARALILRDVTRYLSSGYPVLVATKNHVFVLCGFMWPGREPVTEATLIRHDDRIGPYKVVTDPCDDTPERHPGRTEAYEWMSLLPTTPAGVWLDPQSAEIRGAAVLLRTAQRLARPKDKGTYIPEAGSVEALLEMGDLDHHTYVIAANDFKTGLEARGMPQELIPYWRLQQMPKYLVVVEIIDGWMRSQGVDCVLGEMVFDATSAGDSPQALAVHVPGAALFVSRPKAVVCSPAYYGSASRAEL